MSARKQTPSQTVGPFFSYGLASRQYDYDFEDLGCSDLVREGTEGEVISIAGTLYTGDGQPMKHAIVESWQADSAGVYPPVVLKGAFSGFGRVGTGREDDPRYRIRTIKPGSVDGNQAPHIALTIFSRGLMHHVFTRLYFSDESDANERDPLLQQLTPAQRQTLIAQRVEDADGISYQFDIHMQGTLATTFLEF